MDRHINAWLLFALLWNGTALTALSASPVITDPPVSRTIFIGDPASFQVGASGTSPLTYQWFRNGVRVSGATNSNLAFTTTTADHLAQFTVQVMNSSGTATSAPALLMIDLGVPGPTQTNRWIEITHPWLYRVDKLDLGTAWREPDYADSAWTSGGGLLYVENSSLPAPKTTALPLTAGNLPLTCYFRTSFSHTLTNAFAIQLVANTVIDDGAVFYLNGEKAFGLGMDDGAVSYTNLANRTIGDAAFEGPFSFPVTNLLRGRNVLAAEIHQNDPGSSDIVLGLTLDAVWQPRFRDSNAPVVTAAVPPDNSTVSSLKQIEVRFSEEVWNVDAVDLLINGVAATNVIVVTPDNYLFQFPSPATGAVSVAWTPHHGITDRSANSNAFMGTGFNYVLAPRSSAVRLPVSSVVQSTDDAPVHSALQAVDGTSATFSLTRDLPGSYWRADLGRPFRWNGLNW